MYVTLSSVLDPEPEGPGLQHTSDKLGFESKVSFPNSELEN